MAAYAALVSLENIIHNLEHHSRTPITLHKEQARLLTQKVNFLQDFLKVYNPTLPYSKEADPLEARIAAAAYAAEDAIESHIFHNLNNEGIAAAAYEAKDAIESHIFDNLDNEGRRSQKFEMGWFKCKTPWRAALGSATVKWRAALCCFATVNNSDGENMSLDSLYGALEKVTVNNSDGENMSLDSLYEALEKVIEDMALIEKEAMKINKETGRFQNHHLHTKSTTPADSFISSSSSSIVEKKSSMVGADDLLLEMKEKLVADARDLQTIPVVGMGGSGKTTLALNIYEDALIKERFDIRAWVTISQEYSVLKVLIQLLTQLIGKPNEELSGGELEEMLYKHVYGRKYMIILDDVWSLEAWDGVKRSLPNNRNGSRIVITTRLTTLASTLSKFNSVEMKLLDDDDSWDLLSKSVFGGNGCCPSGLEDTGKKIGKSCKGLPLSIVVVGGVLAKSEKSLEFWKYMEENLNEIVNLEDDERCLKTLYMSYKQLPVHLKPCFLYMGIYREDYEISISVLVKLWVSEGFLKPINGKRLEDIAREYLKELIGRNLILVHEWGSIGSIKKCKVHDLLRDLCLREARKEGFYTVNPGHKIGNEMCRIVRSSTILEIDEEVDALSSAVPSARSLIFDEEFGIGLPPNIFRLLRIVNYDIGLGGYLDCKLVNLRSLTIGIGNFGFPNLACLFWNLHTLADYYYQLNGFNAPTDIWYMPRIRHLYFVNLYLPDPPPNNAIVLENLQSLGDVYDFICSEQMVKTIPNIRKLRLCYEYKEGVDDETFCLTNLECLHKLESLNCHFERTMYQTNYPQSLKKLDLTAPYWEDYVLDKIGALPFLQKLTLQCGTFKQVLWETSEGQFRSLKYLSLLWCGGLHVWTSEASHFPRLEQLHLDGFFDLEEIPSDFADIPTLRLIDVDGCCDSAVESAYRILEEQEELYGEEETTLQVQVQLYRTNNREVVKSFKSPNFHFTWRS